ncbi:MAG: S8 family serine peptidase, partial [Anaerolineae bacterium]
MLNNGGFGYDSWIHAAFEWLMAPAGDPNLAPHVVNGSWGSTNMQDEVFRTDIQALVAAGIVPVFAAGNEGPRSSSIRIPAAYPEAIAVGATDDLDQVAYFSSRGPSSWSEVKPEVTAPGTQIWSSLPGGTFGAYNGTSMASPHVAGLAALLLQADPALTVADLETLITTTAKPIGDQVPNADAGWGRIDVYRAAAVAMHAGHLAGQVTRYPDYKPLPGAQVVVSDRADEQQTIVQTDTAGRYLAALIPGQFDLTVDAFGYQPQTVFDIDVQSYTTTTVDLTLDPLPAGVLWGQVRDAETDGPVGAAVHVVGTPAQTTSDPTTGNYSLSLPAGTYSLDVVQNGYLRHTIPGVEILANQALRVDIALVSAPTLLLVDSGPWYYDSQASYFQQALDDNSLVHALWEIRDPNTDIPSLDTLSAYDVTIWSSPLDAPGLIGAGDVISDYLSVGGRLLLTGQDVGYWDGGLSGITWHPYYTRYLEALALSDNAGRSDIVGMPHELLQGLQMPINGTDSANNQYAPDMIDLLDPRNSAITVQYLEGGGAGLRVSGCQSYRAAYLAAGLEGVGTQESRAEAMHRLVDWLGAPPPVVDAKLYPSQQEAVWLLGSHITYTLELLNAGAHADEFIFEVSQADWPATVWNSDFTKPITQSIALGTCQTQTLGVQVEVPSGVTWNTSDVVTLTVRSVTDPTLARQAVFASKAPAPILLVDDHRWYDVLGSYKAALSVNDLPYDLWEINTSPYGDLNGPSLERLGRYPQVIWFTGYAWNST